MELSNLLIDGFFPFPLYFVSLMACTESSFHTLYLHISLLALLEVM